MSAANHLSAAVVLHPCAHASCDALAFLARCDEHTTDEDRARLDALDRAIAEAADLEERWLAAQGHVADLEAELGIVRAPEARG